VKKCSLVVKTSSAKTTSKMIETGKRNIKQLHIAHGISQRFMNVVKQPSLTFSEVYRNCNLCY